MRHAAFIPILMCILVYGCSKREQTGGQTYEVRISNESQLSHEGSDSSSEIVRQIELFTEGDRTAHINKGLGSHTRVSVREGRGTGTLPGTARIILIAKLKSENGSQLFQREAKILTHSGSAGGPFSHTVDSGVELSDLATFAIESGDYVYGEDVLLGTFEGQNWVLTVK